MTLIKKTAFDLANIVYMRVCMEGKMKTDTDLICVHIWIFVITRFYKL